MCTPLPVALQVEHSAKASATGTGRARCVAPFSRVRPVIIPAVTRRWPGWPTLPRGPGSPGGGLGPGGPVCTPGGRARRCSAAAGSESGIVVAGWLYPQCWLHTAGLGPGAEGPLRATPRDGPRHMQAALREPRLAAQFKLAATPVWGRLPVRPRAAQPHGQRSGQYSRLVCATTAAAFSAFILDGRPRCLRPH
jgi:hypothetical protein